MLPPICGGWRQNKTGATRPSALYQFNPCHPIKLSQIVPEFFWRFLLRELPAENCQTSPPPASVKDLAPMAGFRSPHLDRDRMPTGDVSPLYCVTSPPQD